MSDNSVPNSGWGSSGVGKNSPASHMQSDLGNVSKGSHFSNYQSSGARSGYPAGNSTHSAGFTSGGVAADSPASRIQSTMGNVPKGSNFSQMQRGKK